MRPTSRELIEGIADALRARIAPLLADQAWPASYLRSIDTLLAHLADRVEHEHGVLAEDNDDLRALLTALVDADVAASTARDVLDSEAPAPATASTTDLHAANVDYRAALERAIHEVHASGREDLVELVRAYLRREAVRDRRLYGAFQGRPPF